MKSRLFSCCLALALLSCAARAATTTAGGDDAPPWLRQATNTPSASTYGKDVPAVVLLDESKVTVEDDGRVVTTNYYAVRILTREGRGAATGREVYLTDGGKIREMRAWLIDSAGQVKRYGKDRAVDLAIVDNDIYNEARVRVLRLSDEAEAGTVFGYEATVEERSVFTQFERIFQDRLPTLVSRYSFTVPPGWRAESVTFNHAKLEPTVAGTTYTWELRDLPFIEEEPASPEVTNLVPRLAVSLFPAPNARANLGRSFGNWAEVSRWLTELSANQAELDDPLAQGPRPDRGRENRVRAHPRNRPLRPGHQLHLRADGDRSRRRLPPARGDRSVRQVLRRL